MIDCNIKEISIQANRLVDQNKNFISIEFSNNNKDFQLVFNEDVLCTRYRRMHNVAEVRINFGDIIETKQGGWELLINGKGITLRTESATLFGGVLPCKRTIHPLIIFAYIPDNPSVNSETAWVQLDGLYPGFLKNICLGMNIIEDLEKMPEKIRHNFIKTLVKIYRNI